LFTLNVVEPQRIYDAVQLHTEEVGGQLHAYSRLPLRQLLRYLSIQQACWWISDHPSQQSIPPVCASVLDHLVKHLPGQHDVVILESLDWFVQRNGETDVLGFLQQLDALSKQHLFDVMLPVDPLTFDSRFWMRLRSLAPEHELLRSSEVEPAVEVPDEEGDPEQFAHQTDQPAEELLVHLVRLPRLGFNKVVLARRMLQWKRMGFDLSELEPAILMENMDDAFSLYHSIETQIVHAIDALRYIETHGTNLTTTERHRYHYRLMHLMRIEETTLELEELVSTRQSATFSLKSSHP
jgi:hypothetical protein